jgi:predicted GNAT family N-acyltransferase
MEVRQISPSDTYAIRLAVLRSSGELKDVQFEGDDDEQTFHLGGFAEKKLVSISSFYFQKHKSLPGENHFRLRGMATLPEFRHKGFSSELLRTAFPIVAKNFCTLLWCNARVSAQGFYQKVGFNIHSEIFDIPGIGPHILMSRDV